MSFVQRKEGRKKGRKKEGRKEGRKSVKKTRRKTRLLVTNMARMKLHLVLARSMVERERKMRAGKENLAVNTPRP